MNALLVCVGAGGEKERREKRGEREERRGRKGVGSGGLGGEKETETCPRRRAAAFSTFRACPPVTLWCVCVRACVCIFFLRESFEGVSDIQIQRVWGGGG